MDKSFRFEYFPVKEYIEGLVKKGEAKKVYQAEHGVCVYDIYNLEVVLIDTDRVMNGVLDHNAPHKNFIFIGKFENISNLEKKFREEGLKEEI